jgi:hypothetical protein
VGTGQAGDGATGPPFLASAASADVVSAFGTLEQVDFAALHVERVTAHLEASRGLAEAAIVSASAPRRVHPGEVVRVRLLARLYRQGLRRLSFRLRIPFGAHGPLVATIRGPAAPSGPTPPGQGLGNSLASAFGGGSASGPPPPGGEPISSMAELQQAIAGLANYDGLYASLPGHGKRPVYRNRSLLITGRATVPFVVAG